jgi:predicted MFS family arabinose efflux permease
VSSTGERPPGAAAPGPPAASGPAAAHPGAGAAPAVSRWGPVAGFVLVSSANQMLWLNFAPITTGSAARLGVSSSTVGLASEVFPLVYVLLALPVGRALDRWFRPTLLAGAVLTAGGAALRLAGHGFAPVIAGQVVIAVGQPAVLNAVTGVATRSLTAADRPVGIALGSAGTFLGFVEAFVLGLVLGAAHLHAVLVVSAAYAAAGLALLAAQLWRPSLAGALARPAGQELATTGQIREVWADPVVRTIAALVFVGFGVFVALTTWVQTLLQPAGVGPGAADGLLLVMVVAGVVSSVAVPATVARRGAQPLVLAVAAGGGLVSCTLLAADPGTAVGYVALGLFGLVLLPALPVLLELIETRNPARAATATALLWLAGNAGGIVVALVVQAVVHHGAVSFALMAVVALLALPLAARLRSRLRQPTPPRPPATGGDPVS